jgi:KaiC/GvpD/RAD55 family RecA-like ATPase
LLVSSGIPALDEILTDGFPDRSSVLVMGQAGIGKEALGYWFTHSGLLQGDYCLYVTHRPVDDTLREMKAFGVPTDRVPDWIASSGSPTKCDLEDFTSISFNLKRAVQRNAGRRIRIVTDVISPLLVLNPQPIMYQYWSRLLGELKQSDSVILAMVEEGMHSENTIAALEQQFDGVIELRLQVEGISITPLLRVKKMLGLPPLHGFFRFSVTNRGMEVVPFVK